MKPNCQCNADLQAGWHVRFNQYLDRNQSVPCWYCCECDAFAGEMDARISKDFKDRYFKVPKSPRGTRAAFCRNYRYQDVRARLMSEANKRARSKRKAVCGEVGKNNRPCLIPVRAGTKCHHHRDKQLSLFQ